MMTQQHDKEQEMYKNGVEIVIVWHIVTSKIYFKIFPVRKDFFLSWTKNVFASACVDNLPSTLPHE